VHSFSSSCTHKCNFIYDDSFDRQTLEKIIKIFTDSKKSNAFGPRTWHQFIVYCTFTFLVQSHGKALVLDVENCYDVV